MADYQQNTFDTFAHVVENELSAPTADALTLSAGRSFLRSLGRNRRLVGADAAQLRQWIAEMAIGNVSPQSRKRYFGRIRSVYRRWVSLPGADPFREAEECLKADLPACDSEALVNRKAVERLIKIADNPDSPDCETAAIALYLIYNPEASLADIIATRFDSDADNISQCADIISAIRSRTLRKKYVFGLGQGLRRRGRIVHELTARLGNFLRQNGMRFGETFSRQSLSAIWASEAISSAEPLPTVRELAACVPPTFPTLGLALAADLAPNERTAVLQRIANRFNNNTMQWFAMNIRAGHNADEVRRRIADELPDLSSDIIFYYPTRPFTTIVGRKRIVEERPLISGVLFFKTLRSRVSLIFRKIGDAAWCYRLTNAPGSSYCTISNTEMAVFQRHVGALTPDVAMQLIEATPTAAVGQRVEIVGGDLLEGHIGHITAITSSQGRTIYTLSLSASTHIRWESVKIDSILTRPL